MIKAIKSGKMPIFKIFPNSLMRLSEDEVVNSFWISNAKSTSTPMIAKEPLMATVVTVVVVTVEIINYASNNAYKHYTAFSNGFTVQK
jgi:hypothetical protein